MSCSFFVFPPSAGLERFRNLTTAKVPSPAWFVFMSATGGQGATGLAHPWSLTLGGSLLEAPPWKPPLGTTCRRPRGRGGSPPPAARCHAARRGHHRTECACHPA